MHQSNPELPNPPLPGLQTPGNLTPHYPVKVHMFDLSQMPHWLGLHRVSNSPTSTVFKRKKDSLENRAK